MDPRARTTSDPGVVASRLPDRYPIRETGDGRRYLTAREAPTVRVMISDGAVSASAARNAPPGTLFLDGAAQGAPFLDTERNVYNLDHHEDCVRAFTLAACEQALVLVLKGFDLRDREWTVRANEPDLDTVLALWVLLNHMRLGSGTAVRRRVIPLIRLEGVIDAHGLELEELCGFPEPHHRETQLRLDRLRAREVELSELAGRAGFGAHDEAAGRLERTAAMLREVDSLVYVPEDFDHEHVEVEELARVELPTGGLVVACRSRESIYRVEQGLRWLYGNRLAVLVLEKDGGAVTLRQVDAFLPATLEAAYAELNLVDPAAGRRGSDARWGGSAEIGGSPRGRGSRLAPHEIAEACARAYREPTWRERAAALGRGTAAALAGLAAAWGAARGVLEWAPSVAPALAAALALLAVAAAGLGLARADRRPGLFGLWAPAGHRWWLLLPGALVGAGIGGAAVPGSLVSGAAPLAGTLGREDPLWGLVLAAVLLPVALELLFRGLVQPCFSRAFRRRAVSGPWIPRPPAALSALFYALTPWVLAPLLWRPPSGVAPESAGPLLAVVGALLVGLSCALARDRSESVVAPAVIHLIAVVLWTLVALIL